MSFSHWHRFPEILSASGHGTTIPGSSHIASTKRFQTIVSQPVFQRLRGVRQLAFAHLVYPGATHTRFEHSIGVFAAMARLLRGLLTHPEQRFADFADSATPQEIGTCLLAALLHDIGQYPMAHFVEEQAANKDRLYKHDDVTRSLIKGGIVAKHQSAQALTDAIEMWDTTPNDICAVLANVPAAAKHIRREMVPLFHTLLDGPFDVDKLDYLRRDSIHTGHPAGQGIDGERLASSVAIDVANNSLGVRERGLEAAQSLTEARYAMFRNVYWHRTNRAFARMATEAWRLAREKDLAAFHRLFEHEILWLDDERVLAKLYDSLDKKARTLLVAPLFSVPRMTREPFRRLAVLIAGVESPKNEATELHGEVSDFFGEFIRGVNAAAWRTFDEKLRANVLSLLTSNDHESFEVLLDVPDPRFEHTVHSTDVTEHTYETDFVVFADHEGRDGRAHEKAVLIKELNNRWRFNARRIRVFASELLFTKLTDKLGESLEKEIFAALRSALKSAEPLRRR